MPAVRWRCVICGFTICGNKYCSACMRNHHLEWERLRNLICGGGRGVRKRRAELIRVNHAIMLLERSR